MRGVEACEGRGGQDNVQFRPSPTAGQKLHWSKRADWRPPGGLLLSSCTGSRWSQGNIDIDNKAYLIRSHYEKGFEGFQRLRKLSRAARCVLD